MWEFRPNGREGPPISLLFSWPRSPFCSKLGTILNFLGLISNWEQWIRSGPPWSVSRTLSQIILFLFGSALSQINARIYKKFYLLLCLPNAQTGFRYWQKAIKGKPSTTKKSFAQISLGYFRNQIIWNVYFLPSDATKRPPEVIWSPHPNIYTFTPTNLADIIVTTIPVQRWTFLFIQRLGDFFFFSCRDI